MKVQWYGSNVLEICSFLGHDISKLLVSGQLFIPTTKGFALVPVGAYIKRNADGTFDILNEK